MNNYGHVVAWYDSEEWKSVYEEILNSSSNKEKALNTLLVWKVRCPSLPSGIESTLSLLQVHVEDNKQNEKETDSQILRLAYSSAIMRFVNHMLDTETVKGSSLYKAALTLGVPEWVIDLRHNTAHSNTLPHITLLREACAISLQWLKENYWEKHKSGVLNYFTGKPDGDITTIAAAINLCTSLSICAHPNCKIKNLSDIPNIEMRESIVNDVQDFFGNLIDVSNLKTTSIMSIINALQIQIKNLMEESNVGTHFNEIILGQDSVFLNRELLLFFSAKDFKYKNKLNNSYVQCFGVFLAILHSNDLILEFILALIKITQNSESPHFKAQLAALWVSEILTALKRCQEFNKKLDKMNTKKRLSKNKQDLKQLYLHWFPSNKGSHLTLDLQKPVPEQLTNINYIQPIIEAFNPFLIYFVKGLLDLIEPSLPSLVSNKVVKLAQLISTPEMFLCTTTTVYTAADLKVTSDDDDDVEITDIVYPEEVSTAHIQDNQVVNTNTIWKLAPKNHDWSTCPIGQLPWQQNINATEKIMSK